MAFVLDGAAARVDRIDVVGDGLGNEGDRARERPIGGGSLAENSGAVIKRMIAVDRAEGAAVGVVAAEGDCFADGIAGNAAGKSALLVVARTGRRGELIAAAAGDDEAFGQRVA